MKPFRIPPAAVAALLVPTIVAADLAMPAGFTASDGALVSNSLPQDGNGNPTRNLAEAATGVWTTAGPAGKGVYDPDQWAVVFKYSSVTINHNVNRSLYFPGHPSGAPVIWLVDGNVTISAPISVSGDPYRNDGIASTPGVGGGAGGSSGSAGLGPGGGGFDAAAASGGTYRTKGGGAKAAEVYGNSMLFPLVGGSGGSGRADRSGGAGGGALLIYAKGTITLNHTITANGGQGNFSGSGSGGALRLVADTITGGGNLHAFGAGGSNGGGAGGSGGVRIEAVTTNLPISGTYLVPPYCTYASLAPGASPKVFLDASDPTVKAVKFTHAGGGEIPAPIPTDPRGFLVIPTDVTLPAPGNYQLHIDCANVPTDWIVSARFILTNGTDFTVKSPTIAMQSGDQTLSHWAGPVAVPGYITTVQVRADAP